MAEYNSGVQNGIFKVDNSSVFVTDGLLQQTFHSYQLKTRRSGSSGHAIANTGQLKSGKTLPGPMYPGSWEIMLMAESGFGVSPWPHPAWCQQYRLVAVMYWCGECFPGTCSVT
jgi:hypothetical protein